MLSIFGDFITTAPRFSPAERPGRETHGRADSGGDLQYTCRRYDIIMRHNFVAQQSFGIRVQDTLFVCPETGRGRDRQDILSRDDNEILLLYDVYRNFK